MEINKTVLYNAIGLTVAAAAAIGFIYYEQKNQPASVPGASGSASAPEGLNKPRGLAMSGSTIVVANSKHFRVESLDANGGTVAKFGTQGKGDGEFSELCDVAVDSEGNIYVADTFYSKDPKGGLPWGRIQKFTKKGKFKSTFGPAKDPVDLFGPRAIAVNSKDEVFLSDTGNHRLIKYSADGKFLAQVGTKGSKPGEFLEPFGIAFDAQDNLYVADRLNYRVQVFSAALKPLRSIKVNGWDAQQINMEPYVAVDKVGKRLFVSDPMKNKVYSYNLTGGDKKEITKGDKGAFNLPTGLAFDQKTKTLLVSDAGNRVLRVKP